MAPAPWEGMTTLAYEYTVVHSEIALVEPLPVLLRGVDAAAPDVLPVPWHRVAVGASIGMVAGTLIGILHSGVGAGAVFAAEVMITSTGLGILGSFMACLSAVPTRR